MESTIIYYAKTAALADDRVFEEKLPLLNEQRRAKVLRCRQREDKNRALAAGLLIRHGLKVRGIAYDSATFGANRYGKPCLLSEPGFYFNVSHSGEYAACVCSAQETGIDIERISDRFFGEKGKKRMEQVSDRIFSEQEKRYLCSFGEQERADAFVKLWTRKECYAKAYGEGIRMELAAIDALRDESFFSRRIEDYWLSVFIQTGESGGMEKPRILLEEVAISS